MKISQITEDVIRETLGVVGHADPTRRFLLEGVPEDLLEGLLDRLDGTLLPDSSGSEIPLLVANDSSLDVINEERPLSGSYAQHQITRVRNESGLGYVLAVPAGRRSLESLSEAAEVIPEFVARVEARVFAAVCPTDHGMAVLLKETAGKVLRVRTALVGDPMAERWRVLSLVAELGGGTQAVNGVLAILGLPACSDTSKIGKTRHLKILKEIATQAAGKGLASFFDELKDAASQFDDRSTAITSALKDCRESVVARVMDAASWESDAIGAYAPEFDPSDLSTLPEWWSILDLDVWDSLVNSGPDLPERLRVVLGDEESVDEVGGVHVYLGTGDLTARLFSDSDQASTTGDWSLRQARTTLDSGSNNDSYQVPVVQHSRSLQVVCSPTGQSEALTSERFVLLSCFEPGIVLVPDQASRVTVPYGSGDRFAAAVEFPSIGEYRCKLLLAPGASVTSIIGRDIEQDGEGDETEIDWQLVVEGERRLVRFDLRTDVSSTYEIAYDLSEGDLGTRSALLELSVSAAAEPPTQAKTVMESLLVEHSMTSGSRPDVTADRNTSILMQLEAWKLLDETSYHPGVMPLTSLRRPEIHRPDSWNGWVVGPLPLVSDPRPNSEVWNPPPGLLAAREVVRQQLLGQCGGAGVVEAARLGEAWREPDFRRELLDYAAAFEDWHESDPHSAGWWEAILLMEPSDRGNALLSEPTCILLSPLHPLRLLWQARVQGLLEDALANGFRVPLLAGLTGARHPEAWEIGGRDRTWSFVAIGQESSYWALLWSETQLHRAALSGSVLDALSSLGMPPTSMRHNLSARHVHGMIEDCLVLNPAKGRMAIEICGKDDSGELEEGILQWFDNYTQEGDDETINGRSSFVGDWIRASPLRIDVMGTGGAVEPDSALLAGYAGRETGSLRWFSSSGRHGTERSDLVILAGLPPSSLVVKDDWVAGARDQEGMIGIRPLWMTPGGPVEAIDTVSEGAGQSVSGRASILSVDSVAVTSALERGNLVALPAGLVEPSQIPLLLGDQGVVWKMEYPGFGGSSGIDKGYLVISRISDLLRSNTREILKDLAGSEIQVSDDVLGGLLVDYGKRGFDSLHQTADRSVAARGSLAMLTAVRILQPFGSAEPVFPDDCGVPGGGGFLVPLDAFSRKLQHLWGVVERKRQGGPRPDLLAIAAVPSSDSSCLRIKVTPIEVKCHTGELAVQRRAGILGSQCRRFASMLQKIFVELPSREPAWNVAARLLLAELIAVGARVRAHGSSPWMDSGGAARLSDLTRRVLGKQVAIEVGLEGRLVVVDGSRETRWRHQDADFDQEGFRETLQVDRREAAKFLVGQDLVIPAIPDHWRLLPGAGGSALPELPWRKPVPADGVLSTELTHAEVQGGNEGAVDSGPPAADEGPPAASIGPTAPGDSPDHTSPTPSAPQPPLQPATNTPNFPQPDIILGVSDSDEWIHWQPYGDDSGKQRLNNAHVVVVGSSGGGKSYLLREVVSRQLSSLGVPTLYVDFNDDFTDQEFLDTSGGSLLRADMGLAINPLEVPEHPQHGGIRIMNHVYELHGIFKQAFGLGDQQAMDFKRALQAAYEDFGITEPVIQDAPETWPSFQHLWEHLEVIGNAELLNRVSPLFDLQIFRGGSGGLEESLQKTTVLALSLLPSDMVKKAIADLFLKTTYQYLLRAGHANGIRLAIIIDEAHKVANLPAASTLLKEGRKYGASIWVSSQEPKDFNATVWSNCGTQVFFRIDELTNAKNSAKQLGQASLVEDLRGLSVGHCFLRNLHYQPFTRLLVKKPEGQ